MDSKEKINFFNWVEEQVLERPLLDSEVNVIALKHRNLSQGDKDWKLLGHLLNRNPNTLRANAYKMAKANDGYIEQVQIKDGDIKPLKLTLDDESINQLKLALDEETEEDKRKQFQEDYKEQTKIRDIWNAYRLDLRKESRFEDFKQELINAINTLDELPKVKVCDNPVGETEAVLLLSDLHLGACCNNFYNEYNKTIAVKRLSVLVGAVINYCKKFNVYRLNVCNLGDMIHGFIHTNARIDSEMDVASQAIKAGELVAETLNALQAAAPEIVYRSCTDNHSRMQANKDDNVERENFGRIIDEFVTLRIDREKAHHNCTNVRIVYDNLDPSIGNFCLDNGKNVIFSHGHLDGRNNVFQNYVGATKEYVDYIFLGHWHNGQEKSYQDCKVFINGSICGSEQYAVSKRLFSNPAQKLLIFNNCDDDVVDIDIGLGGV